MPSYLSLSFAIPAPAATMVCDWGIVVSFGKTRNCETLLVSGGVGGVRPLTTGNTNVCLHFGTTLADCWGTLIHTGVIVDVLIQYA